MNKVRTAPLAERLEGRQLFANLGGFEWTVSGSTLRVTGTSRDDDIVLYYDGADHYLKVKNSALPHQLTQKVTGTIGSYYVDGAGGTADKLTIDKLRGYPTGANIEKVAVIAKPLPAGSTPSDLSPQLGSMTDTQIRAHKRIKFPDSPDDTWFFGDSFAELFRTNSEGRENGQDIWFNGVNGANEWETHSINLGVSGQTTQQMLRRIADSGYFNDIGTQPDQIVVMAGTNNLYPVKTGLPNSGTDQQIADGIESVVNALREKLKVKYSATLSRTKFVVLGLTPQLTLGVNARASEINYKLEQKSLNLGRFELANIYDTVTPVGNIGRKDPYFADELHLNKLGYIEVHEEILRVLNS